MPKLLYIMSHIIIYEKARRKLVAKIGKDVLSSSAPKRMVTETFTLGNKEYRQKVREVLQNADRPLNVTEVMRATKLNWYTVKNILMEMLASGQVECFQSAKAIYFQIKKPKKREYRIPRLPGQIVPT